MYGFYLQDQVAAPIGQFFLLAGARYDHAFQYQNNFDGNGEQTVDKPQKVIPRFGLLCT